MFNGQKCFQMMDEINCQIIQQYLQVMFRV